MPADVQLAVAHSNLRLNSDVIAPPGKFAGDPTNPATSVSSRGPCQAATVSARDGSAVSLSG